METEKERDGKRMKRDWKGNEERMKRKRRGNGKRKGKRMERK